MFPGTFVFPLYLTKRHVYGKQSENRWLVKLEIKLTPLTSGPRGKEQRAEKGYQQHITTGGLQPCVTSLLRLLLMIRSSFWNFLFPLFYVSWLFSYLFELSC